MPGSVLGGSAAVASGLGGRHARHVAAQSHYRAAPPPHAPVPASEVELLTSASVLLATCGLVHALNVSTTEAPRSRRSSQESSGSTAEASRTSSAGDSGSGSATEQPSEGRNIAAANGREGGRRGSRGRAAFVAAASGAEATAAAAAGVWAERVADTEAGVPPRPRVGPLRLCTVMPAAGFASGAVSSPLQPLISSHHHSLSLTLYFFPSLLRSGVDWQTRILKLQDRMSRQAEMTALRTITATRGVESAPPPRVPHS